MEGYLSNNFHSCDFLCLLQFFIAVVLLCFVQPRLWSSWGIRDVKGITGFFCLFFSLSLLFCGVFYLSSTRPPPPLIWMLVQWFHLVRCCCLYKEAEYRMMLFPCWSIPTGITPCSPWLLYPGSFPNLDVSYREATAAFIKQSSGFWKHLTRT